jgi:2-oxo-3-hexenedioate decarboxylase
MSGADGDATLDALADALDAAAAGATLLPWPAASAPGAPDLPTAYRVAQRREQRRIADGHEPRGWKIGFTNRTIWPRYGVHRPIWGRVWDDTLTLLDGTDATVSLAGLVQPRLEPEIVFGLGGVPAPGMDDAALCACLEWVAHGVEIVHIHVDGWRFDGPVVPVLDGGLHGRLVVGPRTRVRDWPTLAFDLAALTLAIECDGRAIDLGVGTNVLDGPVNALRLWLQAMAIESPDWHAAAGDVVTTGTITDAWPVQGGQTWRTRPDHLRLPGLTIGFTR